MIEETLALAIDGITELLSSERCLIDEPPSGEGTLNTVTGQVEFPTAARVYDGDAVRQSRTAQRGAAEGGGVARVDECSVRLPERPPGVRVGQLVTFPDSGDVTADWKIIRIPETSTPIGFSFVAERLTGDWTTGGEAA